jgi:hypothetical protein
VGRALLGIVLLGAAGCVTDLDVKDRDVLFPTLRVSKGFAKRWYIDLTVDYGEGSDSEQVTSAGPIEFGGSTFSAGAVDVDFSLLATMLAARANFRPSEQWDLNVFFGAVVCYTDVTVTNGVQTAHDTTTSIGPLVGGQFGYCPHERIQLYARPFLSIGGAHGDYVGLAGVDLGAQFRIAGPVRALAGWRLWQYEEQRSMSDLECEYSGPFLGLSFEF